MVINHDIFYSLVFQDLPTAKDWKEKLGYFFLKPYYAGNSYYKITFRSSDQDLKCEKIAQTTHHFALRLLFSLLHFVGIQRIGKTCLAASNSYKNKWEKFEKMILPDISSCTSQDKNCKTSHLSSDFEKIVYQWSLLTGIMQDYAESIQSQDNSWSSEKATKFLLNELSLLNKEINETLPEIKLRVLRKNTKNENDLKQIDGLIDQFKNLNEENQNLIQILQARLPEGSQPTAVIGLANDGNTCYLNSALQVLLALPNFPQLIPEKIQQIQNEKEEDFKNRQQIFDKFKQFIHAYRQRQAPNELGKLIGQLRATIFQAGLSEGGFIDQNAEKSFQDAGSFFELILHVIGRNFTLKTRKIYPIENRKPYCRIESEQHAVLFLKQQGSIQQKIEAFGLEIQGELSPSDAFRYEGHSPPLLLTKFTEKSQIHTPPEVLVIELGAADSPYSPNSPYQINIETDLLINCAPLFGERSKVEYELTGFCQNHHQIHWTAVVRKNLEWIYCNDSQVTPITPEDEDFKRPANYLVYTKKY